MSCIQGLPRKGIIGHNLSMPTREQNEREHFFGAAKIIAALTLASRVLGMLRDMAIASFGSNRSTAAFIVAFQIPNLFRRLFGEGALAGAFVPVFTDTAESHGQQTASRLLANCMGLLAVAMLVLMAVVQIGLVVWVSFWPGQWDRRLLVGLTTVMLPFMVTICLLALASAGLNCRGRFAYPAAAPILLNIFIISSAWWVSRLAGDISGKLYIVAASVTLAGIVQLAAAILLLRSLGFSVRPKIRPVEPGIRPIMRLMLPMMLGLGFLQISPLFDSIIIWVLSTTEHAPTITLFGREIAKPLSAGAQMHVYTAQRLYQFPMGVLAISLAVAVFPLLSRYASRGDLPSLRASLTRAIRLAMMEGLAAGMGLFMLAEPITHMLFVRGNFTPADAQASAQVLRTYAIGMWAYCAYQIFSRAFFAIKQPRTPLVVSSALVVVNLALVVVLVWLPWCGVRAFGLATTSTAVVNTCILMVIFRRKIQRIGGKELAVSVARSLVCCLAMAGVLWQLGRLLQGRPAWMIVTANVPAGAAVFLAVAWVLRAPEIGEILGLIRRRSSQSASSQPADEL